jgi:hypothetical protein
VYPKASPDQKIDAAVALMMAIGVPWWEVRTRLT